MYLFLAFLMVPLIEIGLFIQVGGAIGLWPTLAIVVLTAILGTSLVRSQGRMALGQMRNSFQSLSDPAEPLAHGAMILFAGALLLTPGFFTDAVGFALLMPPVRMAVYRYISKRVTVAQFQMGPGSMQGRHYPGDTNHPPRGGGDVIDGDFEEVTPKDPSDRASRRPSGWVEGPK
ncbi:Suppressor of F exclusion of phage T7 [Phaeobacter sp. CECT 5382]|uniref:FxsA family protein n=1 Tax=Rhodobacterales TaxID=204455 RepID=UPI0006DA0F5C|nr:FxsA family protein [Phaeobacter sp. CECT 5382]CUH86557.1 Suppressor of F exclusion of phage T7 [Phaeobacter sp. CECT 5382]